MRRGAFAALWVEAAAPERVRALLRAKYGWRDAWVALLQNTSRSVAPRLRPSRREG